MALDLKAGESLKGAICPACEGGDNKDKSFNLTRFASCTKYICFRAKCGISGVVSTSPVDDIKAASRAANALRSRVYCKPTRSLTPQEVENLSNLYGIRDTEYFKMAKRGIKDGRVLYPIYTYEGVSMGHACKSASSIPKVVNYIPDIYIKLHFPLDVQYIKDDRIVIVEDVLSATRLVDNGIPAVALLGTHLSADGACHLVKLGFIKWDVALDDDAKNKAAKILKSYTSMADIKVLTWESKEDVKDMTEKEFNEVFFKEEEE